MSKELLLSDIESFESQKAGYFLQQTYEEGWDLLSLSVQPGPGNQDVIPLN